MASRILALAAALVLVAGCAAPPPDPVGATGPARTSDPATASPTGTAPPTGSSAEPGQALPAFMGVPLTDVRSGDTFTLGDFAGKVVIVQAMAVW
ncbi:MAG TPA: hypothetical protein VMJ92_02615 [Candidatus Limnocylindrales bacterium]|nr:hypothetical protein [Candidatus Limnocylindrales bacterium]